MEPRKHSKLIIMGLQADRQMKCVYITGRQNENGVGPEAIQSLDDRAQGYNYKATFCALGATRNHLRYPAEGQFLILWPKNPSLHAASSQSSHANTRVLHDQIALITQTLTPKPSAHLSPKMLACRLFVRPLSAATADRLLIPVLARFIIHWILDKPTWHCFKV